MLTNRQKAHFDVFGFLAVRQLFSPDEVDVITREFDAAMLEHRGGKPFDGKERQSMNNWMDGRPAVEYLATDERIRGPIKQLLGPGYTPSKHNDANLYVGETEWHPDLGWDPSIPEGRNDTPGTERETTEAEPDEEEDREGTEQGRIQEEVIDDQPSGPGDDRGEARGDQRQSQRTERLRQQQARLFERIERLRKERDLPGQEDS